MQVVMESKENLFFIEMLKDFQVTDEDDEDEMDLVRYKADSIITLIKDEERLQLERNRAQVWQQLISKFGIGSPLERCSKPKTPRPGDNLERNLHLPTTGSSYSILLKPHRDLSWHSQEDIQLLKKERDRAVQAQE